MRKKDQAALAKLQALHLGFRTKYLDHETIGRQLAAWRDAYPHLVRLESLTKTREGRDLWLVTIGPDPDRVRPAVWVDGNMHASELCGSSVALAVAEDVLAAHLAPSAGTQDLPAHVLDLIRRDVLFHILPRMSPDGAEAVLTTGRWVRSNPRDDRQGKTDPYWRLADVDGDGLMLLMRREDPAGDYVASPDFPGLMLPRRIEDEGPYYAVYPEGFIEGFDGTSVPAPYFLSDNETDMNRNFPYQWAPEPRQEGAGPYAASEPESRAVVEAASCRPNVFVWANLHTFGGVYIRPAGDKPDAKMNKQDLAVYRQLEEWGERYAGYPTVSGFHEFTYEPETPLCGDLAEYAWAQRGAIGFVCELWDFFRQVGLPILRPFVWNYQRRKREEALAMAEWDRDENHGRIVGSFRPFEHPQLGPVEIGGYDPRVGLWNPPYERIDEVCNAQSRVILRLAAMAPRLVLSEVESADLGHGLVRVSAVVENHGYLPTYVLASSRVLPWNDPVRASLVLPRGLELVSGSPTQGLVTWVAGVASTSRP